MILAMQSLAEVLLVCTAFYVNIDWKFKTNVDYQLQQFFFKLREGKK